MAKYRVIVDKGVEIGGRRYPHGAVIDSERLTERDKTVPLKDNATEEEKAEASKDQARRYEVEKSQAGYDLEAQLKRGTVPGDGGPYLEPVGGGGEAKKREG